MLKSFNEPFGKVTERMDGSKAERYVLGYLDNAGFSFFRNDPKLREEVVKIVEILRKKGYEEKFLEVYDGGDRTEEEKLELLTEHVLERFLEVNYIKTIESGFEAEDRTSQGEKDIDGMIKQVFNIRAATSQVQRISTFNKEHDPDFYEKMSTPFTTRLVESLKQRLSKKFPDAKVIYTSAIFENDNLKTHLDGIRGMDAYLIVFVENVPRIFYIDYTGKPEKTEREILERGYGVKKVSGAELKDGDAKFVVYIDFSKINDGAILAQTGDILAKEIVKEYT